MENFYTPQEIAVKLKINKRTVYRWIREEKLKAYKVGNLWRVPESEIDRLIKGEKD